MKNILSMLLLSVSLSIPLLVSAESHTLSTPAAFTQNSFPSLPTIDRRWQDKSDSCRYVAGHSYGLPHNDNMEGVNVPMVIHENECYVRGLTTQSTFPDELRAQLGAEVDQHFQVVEHNFSEISTDAINEIAAESDTRVRNIKSKVQSPMRLFIDGIVNAHGDVPVFITGFDIETVGHLRKYQLGLPINVYVKLSYKNISVKGTYNVFDQRFTGIPNFVQYKPSVDVDVQLPWLFRLIDELTPGIFDSMYERFALVVTYIFELIGIEMGRDIPTIIAHNSQLLRQSFTPITALRDYGVGDHVYLDMEASRNWVYIKDKNTTYVVSEAFLVMQ
ncbi:hypothetical protein HUZ36_18005 [Pseudoalteromonas sp. McH1-7]|uniref:hypothetical protein n=1 Tax=unclassified Pseudoalteromonas TaxID=194690 RepID=UPI000FFEAD75|nr:MULTISPECIES: hypothetical protein [unclassified Pseudoalteromonas]NUZ12680.1 hypothetical protein [Pseudoalteromonas sp. McH1-7]